MIVLHEETTPYSEYRIVQRGDRIDMEVKGAVFAVYDPTQMLSGYSWDALTAGAALCTYQRVRRVLMLGVAGGTALRQMRHLWPQAELVGIEIDGQLMRAAQQWMGLDDVGATLIHADADSHIKKLKGTFDVIVDDLYKCGADDVERGGLPFAQRLVSLKKWLSPQGLLVANFINDVGFEMPLENGVRAFESNFSQVACVEATFGLNKVMVGGRRLAPPEHLADFSGHWSKPKERRLWDSLSVTGLKNYP
jgi:spermidine synthase